MPQELADGLPLKVSLSLLDELFVLLPDFDGDSEVDKDWLEVTVSVPELVLVSVLAEAL